MIVGNVTQEQVQQAASAVCVRVSHEGIRPEGRRWRLTLVPGVQGQWQRTSTNMAGRGRRVNAACWHGYYAFMRELYRLAPSTIIRSAMTHYQSAEDLEANAWESGERNIGSQVAPVSYEDACKCEPETHDQGDAIKGLVVHAVSLERVIHYSPPCVRNHQAVTGPTACGAIADGQHITFQEHKATCSACRGEEVTP